MAEERIDSPKEQGSHGGRYEAMAVKGNRKRDENFLFGFGDRRRGFRLNHQRTTLDSTHTLNKHSRNAFSSSQNEEPTTSSLLSSPHKPSTPEHLSLP